MKDADHFYALGRHPVDQDIVGMGDQLASAGNPSGTIQIGGSANGKTADSR